MSKLLRTDVTSVKFYKDFVLAGIGSYINIFERNKSHFIQRLHTLKGQKIYGIVPRKYDNIILVFGGKQYTIIRFNAVDHSFERCCEPVICNDWMHSGIWVGEDKVALLTAHNVVQIWNIKSRELESEYPSKENSILYSGLLVPLCDGVLVFSGTVFSEVLISCCENTSSHYLKGHKGVIFSISCNTQKGIIVTTSDDRSVRIWSVENNLSTDYNTVEFWKHITVSCKHEMYGHSARVMNNCITDDYIISIGEDSGIVFWDFNGKLLRKATHSNSCIWSLDASDKYLITGGGDSAVILHPLSIITDHKQLELINLYMDAPKKVILTARRNIVALNECNDLAYYNVDNKIETHYKLAHESTFKLLDISSCRQLIAIADMTGKLDVWVENCKGEADISRIVETQLDIGRVLSMNWAGNRHLVICSRNGNISVLAANDTNIKEHANLTLPPCRERWLTACAIKGETLVVGDRCGNIHLYITSQNEPIKSFKHIHGRYGPTSIEIHQNNFITTGRDGTIKYFSLKPIRYLCNKELEFQWVERFVDKNEKYLCGFRERAFVVYDVTLNYKILEIFCGGGHRSWDILRHIDKIDETYCEFIEFMYLKNSNIYLEKYNLSKIVSKPIIYGSHLKEINCLTTIYNNNNTLFISGGEDTTLRISNSTGTDFKDIVIHKQLSNIRTLKVVKINDIQYMLISGGGRAQICVRLLDINDVVTEEMVNYMIKGSDRDRKGEQGWKNCLIDFDPETRIMDIDICSYGDSFIMCMGCSDALLRVFQLTRDPSELKLIKEIKYHDTCILKVRLVKLSKKLILISCTSRGVVSIWDVETLDRPVASVSVHKSGINCVATRTVAESKLLIVTGGDDNSIHANIVETDEMRVLTSWSSGDAHSSQVTGVALVADCLISSSVDQRVTLWRLLVGAGDRVTCHQLGQVYSDVADIQGIDLIHSNE